jgi:proteasome accessory factor A
LCALRRVALTAYHNGRSGANVPDRLRGEFIRRAKERKRDYTVDWLHLKLSDQAQRTVLCKDPFRSHDERVDRLIASL